MLCEITPEPKSLGEFLIVLGFLASVAVNVVTLMGQRTKQKREVTFAEQFVSQEQMDAIARRVDMVERQIEAMRSELKDDKTEILKAGEDRAEKLHNRINDVLQAVSQMRGELHARRMDI